MVFPGFSQASHRPHCGAGAPAWRRCAEAADVFFFGEGKMNLEYLVKRYLMNLDEILDEILG